MFFDYSDILDYFVSHDFFDKFIKIFIKNYGYLIVSQLSIITFQSTL